MHRLTYLRLIRSRGLLARDIAQLIAESSLTEGDRLFDADELPPEGSGLSDRITRAQYTRRERQAQAEWDAATTYDADDDAATRAAFEQLRAMRAAQEAEQEHQP